MNPTKFLQRATLVFGLLGSTGFGQLAAADTAKSPEYFVSVKVGSGKEGDDSFERLAAQGLGQTRVDQLTRQNLALRDRVKTLEQAVIQLQNETARLQKGFGLVPLSNGNHNCMLVTSFDGTFKGRGDSKVAALADVLQKCEQSGGSRISCDANKAQCDRG